MTDTSPPVYNPVSTTDNDAETAGAPDDKPPSYFDVVSQIRAAKAESKNPAELAQRTVSIVCGSFVSTICLGISLIVPVAMLIIGLVYKHDCMIQRNIPLWLIVSGIGGIINAVVKCIGNIISCARFGKKEGNKEPALISCASGLLGLFLLIWFIIGNVWVYSVYGQVQYDRLMPDTYCNYVCYLFSFWVITISWIMLALGCLCFCGLILAVVGVAAICAKK